MTAPFRIIDPSFPAHTIMTEQIEHAQGIETLYDRCFGSGRFAKTAERLREGNQQLLALSRVAVDMQGDVIAAVRLWPLKVGAFGRAVFVGPVAVDEQYRGSGLGLLLTKECMQHAQQAGWPLAILIGDQPYFGKLGFKNISTSDYPAPGYIPSHRFLGLELEENALAENQGKLSVPLAAT